MTAELVKNEKNLYVFHAVVDRVEERFTNIHVKGAGNEAVFQKTSDGWFVLMKNWPSALWFGREKPEFQANDHVKVTIGKV